ncbi:exodeoxyribonuclease VII small subunit [Ornithinimicrobium sp. W1679]|uniref:exodeoxyribonuclease VII small subunit n=1 Tax=unclassified Ornithinimicrobium TaxID=2615080 RepID=UPI003CF61A06
MTPVDATTPEPTPVGQLSYEQARDELVALVSRIESGQVPLEESMLLWERGEELAAHCQAKLDSAQETLDRATTRAGAEGAESPGNGSADEETSAETSASPAADVTTPPSTKTTEPHDGSHGGA